jgi:hypothetical protein
MGGFSILFARIAKVTSAELKTVALAWAMLPVMSAGLRLLGLAKLHARIHRHDLRCSESHFRLQSAKRLALLVGFAARYTPATSTCLSRSILLLWLLRRRGIDAQLRIGTRFVGRSFDAHAWVEWQGEPVNDSPAAAAQFAAFHGPIGSHACPAD